MQEPIQILEHKQQCFVCGMKNQIGLHVNFKFNGQNKVEGKYFPSKSFQSYPGVLHGGIISTLLDGAMNRVLLHIGKPARTGRLSVRFKQEANSNDPIVVSGEIVEIRKKFAQLRAEIRTRENNLIAFGEGTFIFCENNE